GPECSKRGLIFVGIDVIGGRWLTEINVTSPTGIVAIDQFNGSDTPALIWKRSSGRSPPANLIHFGLNCIGNALIHNGYLAFGLPACRTSFPVAERWLPH